MAKKINLSYQDIENSLLLFKDSAVAANEVGYEILKAFGKGDADIRRYREGKGVLSRYDGLLIKGLFGFRTADATRLTIELEAMKQDEQVIKAAPKIIAVSDGTTILAYDMRERDTYENPLNRLYCDFAFFYPLCGIERFVNVDESPADVKAAEKLAKLHDELRAYNEFSSKSELHDLNIFIARLLFCFFAEDTGIFESNLFTGSIVRYTKEDGSDLADYLDAAFNVMDVRVRNEDTMRIISQFPYVNGGLFSKHILIPKMGFRSRKIIIECGELDWKNINPDIFGSMIQAVVDPNVRANQGMHYTSVPNIMKVINPLFLDELRSEYQKLADSFEQCKRMKEVGMYGESQFSREIKPIHKSCQKLLLRMSKMKFFDPACGSGNFLIITYKMLRLLEMDILRLMRQIEPAFDFYDGSAIQLSQFYGIELLDFPHEVAMLSMWLAEHQMNRKLHDDFGVNTRALPLHNITQIVRGNACRIDWNEVCPHTQEEEVFIFGNPPYLGSSMQNKDQKEDKEYIFEDLHNYKDLDYIACWFYKGALFIKGTNARYSFVSTNSICQGEQVMMIWKPIFDLGLEIDFAYQSFKWNNNARNKAAVICVIVGVRNKNNHDKLLFYNEQSRLVKNINCYLLAGTDIIIRKRSTNTSIDIQMISGNKATDDGKLILDSREKNDYINKYGDRIKKYIHPFTGSKEFIRGEERFCLIIRNEDYHDADSIPELHDRFEHIRRFRLDSTEKATRLTADRPYSFFFSSYKEQNSIIIPATSSENRKYIPIGLLRKDVVVSNSANVIYGAELWLFGILTSRMHMAWVRTVGGRLKTDYRYSAQLCYNTFPFPKLTTEKKEDLSNAAEDVLITRAGYPERTLAELYDPEKMPEDLREAHHRLDDLVESCYPGYPFANDEARLECLFKLYEKMTAK